MGDVDRTDQDRAVTLGYRHRDMADLGGPCPCADPGNYVALTVTGLALVITCWCGRTRKGRFDDATERDDFLRQVGA